MLHALAREEVKKMEQVEIDPHMFTGVVSSTPLIEDSVTQSEGCPRTALGLSCLLPDYPCVCTHVDTWAIEESKNQDGDTAIFTLHLRLVPGVGDVATLMDSIELVGYRPDMQASTGAVTVSYRLSRPENSHLRSYLSENV